MIQSINLISHGIYINFQGFLTMKQKYQAGFRLSILLIFFGVCQAFNPLERVKTIQEVSSQAREIVLSSTNSSLNPWKGTGEFSHRYDSSKILPFILKTILMNGLETKTSSIVRQFPSETIEMNLNASALNQEDGQNNQDLKKKQHYVGSKFSSSSLSKSDKPEMFWLFLSLTSGSMAGLIYGVHRLKGRSFQKIRNKLIGHRSTDRPTETYLRKLLTQEIKKEPQIQQLIAHNQIMLDSSGTIQFMGENLIEKLGYEPEELFGEKIGLILEDSKFLWNGSDSESIKPGSLRKLQTKFKGKDGQKIYALLSWAAIRKKEMIQGFLLVVKDVTDLHKLQKVSRNAKRFRQLAERVPTATFIYQDKKFIYVNSAMARLTGYNKKFLKNINFWQLIHPEFHQMLKKGLRAKKKNEQAVHWHGEIKMVTNTGEERWVDFIVSLIKFEQKIALLGTAFDLSDRKQMEESIKSSEKRYRHLIELSPASIFVHRKGELVFVNPAALKLLGVGNSKLILGQTWKKFWLEDYKPLMEAQFKQASQNEGILEPIEHQLIGLKGKPIQMASTFTPVIYEGAPAIMTTGIDITERKQAERALRESEGRYKQLLESVTDYIYTMNVKNGSAIATDHGHGCIAVTGYTPIEHASDPSFWYELVFPADLEAVKQQEAAILSEGTATPIEHRIIHKNGDLRWVKNTPVLRKDAQGRIVSYDGIISDITQRKKSEEKVNYQAFHDVLTGLANRSFYHQRLTETLTKAQHQKHHFAVMCLDLDRFKAINDNLGHEIGDLLLQQVAQRVSNCLRENDILSRWGGDEFTLLLPYIHSAEDAVHVAERIIACLKPKFDLDRHPIHITTSIGMAVYPQDGKDVQTLLRNADLALSRAKEQGCTYRVYTASMNSQASELLALENSLHVALKREELRVYYQPQVNVKTRQIVGMEAFVRWQHPEFGLVFPNRFIPLAEEMGLIMEIGEWILRTACEQNQYWQQVGFPPMQMGVNLSARQFQESHLVDMVAEILEETGLPANLLELEITESIAIQNVEWTTKIIDGLHSLGVQLSMDDFGTGYSSLSYLQKFPFHTLKVDRSFVRNITLNQQDRAIAQAVITLGQGLGLRTIAEGVETIEQLEVLRRMGCEHMQGYLLSRPIPALQATKLLTKYHRYHQKRTA